MIRDYNETIKQIEGYLSDGKQQEVRAFLSELFPTDIAYISSHVDISYRKSLLKEIKTFNNLSDIIHEMQPETIISLVRLLKEDQITLLFSQLDPDDSAKVLECLPEPLTEWVFSHMKSEDSVEAETLLKYEVEQAGRIMSLEFFSMNENATVFEAFTSLKQSYDAETIYIIYVVDDRNHLIGVVSLRDLLKKPNHLTMKEIMVSEIISVHAEMDQEEVASIVERYNLTAVPVVNHKNQLLGVITVDDIIDIIRSEATEDIMKLAGTTEDELTIQSPFKSFFRRMPWLMVSFVGGWLTIHSNMFFETKLPNIQFIYFITIIAGMGGNVASQASTVIVRGLATGKILVSELWQVLFREMSTGILLGLFFGILLGIVASLEFREISLIGICVGGGILGSMLIAATVGSLMPIMFQRINVDPAVATGPFVTTSIDNLGLISYFGLTMLIIRLFGT